MNRKQEWWYFVAVLAGAVLLSKPNCRHGCKTVAQHLFSYGVGGLLG
jgi:hypothetical protein